VTREDERGKKKEKKGKRKEKEIREKRKEKRVSIEFKISFQQILIVTH
jgi:hypothetical protein